jgi:hypothetical protein
MEGEAGRKKRSVQNGAHGTMRDETYYSTTLGKNRRVLVYTPPILSGRYAPKLTAVVPRRSAAEVESIKKWVLKPLS